MENIDGSSLGKRKPMPIEASTKSNPDTEYGTKMSALIKQREDFERGIAEYQGNMNKVRALREKLKKPDLFTEKEDMEKWNMWKLNMEEYEKSLGSIEKQMQELRAEYGESEETHPVQ